ncbi:MAG TPA: AprI/Inh family metalloprotease inhibitor [Methylovirgula sp.]|jgi:hypothetical protein|nr:AprI/Inh family metalloprotease inhibitor [Methylovirgula sp.]
MAARTSYRALCARLRPGASALAASSVALLLALPAFGDPAAKPSSTGFTVPQEKALPGFEVADIPSAPAQAAATEKPKPAVAGRYALMREDGKDRGCVLTLADANNGKGEFGASLSAACKDQGLQIFDPVAWQMDKDRLILSGAKNHNIVRFEQQADGSWQRDGELTRPLTLKKL